MKIPFQTGMAGLLWCATLGIGANAAEPRQAGFLLFSEEEAARQRLDGNAVLHKRHISRGSGPRIELKAPRLVLDAGGREIAETGSDAELVVEFSGTDTVVDMSTLEVESRNGDRVLSLTERLRPYLRENRLDARHLRIPRGKFEIFISIEDKDGEAAQRNYVWVVSGL